MRLFLSFLWLVIVVITLSPFFLIGMIVGIPIGTGFAGYEFGINQVRKTTTKAYRSLDEKN